MGQERKTTVQVMLNIRVNNILPSVSVIIAVYNRVKKLKRALLSLTNQTFRDFEVIIVDDGSGFDILNKAVRNEKQNLNIKYIRHSNRKTAYSLNTGIRLSSGKYITFLDSDDEYEYNHLDLRLRYMTKYQNIDLIHSPAKIIGTNAQLYVPDVNNTSKLIHVDKCIIGATFFGKSRVFRRLKGFRDVYSYDSEFYNRACRFFNVKKYNYRTYKYYRDSGDGVLNILKKKLKY